jgi:hypothetical protein
LPATIAEVWQVIGERRVPQSRADDWAAEISLGARIPDRMPKDEAVALAKSAFAIGYQQAELAHQQTTIYRSRCHIKVGHGTRRISAFVFEAPYEFIEVYAEPGVGAVTASEAEALGTWLRERAREMEPRKPGGWLWRLIARK